MGEEKIICQQLSAISNQLSAFLRMDNDLQVAEPVDRFFLGMTYSLKY